MRKFFVWLLIVVGVVVVADLLSGALFRFYMSKRTLPGDYETTDRILRNFDEDLLVLGSSVALNSINTARLADSLNISAINGGGNGQSMPFYNTLLKAAVAKRPPRKVILALTVSNLVDSGIGGRYNFLAPYYGSGIADIDSVLPEGDAAERVFLKSNFYRMNTIWFRILLYHFVSAGIKGERGFIAKPVPAQFPERENPQLARSNALTVAAERAAQLEEFIRICSDNDIDLTVVLTPRYQIRTDDSQPVDFVNALCNHYGAQFYEDTYMEPFASDSTLFYDATHINIIGSEIYTDTIISRLNEDF